MSDSRISPTCDLDQLEALARAAQAKSFDWYSADVVYDGVRNSTDAAFLAACTPPDVLALIEQARAGLTALPSAPLGAPTLVAGYDATFWHESYNMLRDAITDNLAAFVKDDDVAEEAILVDAVERAAAHIAQAAGAPTPPTPSGDFGSLLSALLHDALTPEQFDAAHAAVLAEYEGMVSERDEVRTDYRTLMERCNQVETRVAALTEALREISTGQSSFVMRETARAALSPTGGASNGN